MRHRARGTLRVRRTSRRVAAACVLALVTGCDLSGPTFPADPDGTLERVRADQVLRAGAAPNPGWVEVDDGRPTGREVRLVEEYAESLDVEVQWTVGTEEHLVGLLEEGRLDLAVGGLTDQNPWVEKVALTRPYVEVTVGGTTEAHVVMLRMGENALLTSLERWLDEHGELP